MNQYVLWCKQTREAAIVDSGAEDPQKFLDYAKHHKLNIKLLLQARSTCIGKGS